MIRDTAENIIRFAAACVAEGTPVENICIVLPSGTPWGSCDDALRAADLAGACIAAPDNDRQRADIISALVRSGMMSVVY